MLTFCFFFNKKEKKQNPNLILEQQHSHWRRDTGTPYFTPITPMSIAYGLSGKPKTRPRANTQSAVPENLFLPRLVPSLSARIPLISRQAGRARFEIFSIRKRDLSVMNICKYFILLFLLFLRREGSTFWISLCGAFVHIWFLFFLISFHMCYADLHSPRKTIPRML